MNIVIAKANTHSDVAKEQHLVPRTYMRQWSYNNTDSIYIFNKRQKEKAVQPANVNSINYIVGFHDIKAGDIFVPDEALEELFGFVSRQCEVIYEGRELDSLRKLNDKFWDYDKWEIFDLDVVKATRKERNEIRYLSVCHLITILTSGDWKDIYGKILLDYSLEKAKELGCGAVCFEGNIDFYGKSGFKQASEFGIRYHGLPEGNPIRLYSLDEITEIFCKLGLRICNSFADFSGKPSSDNDIQLMVYSIRE